MPKEKIESSYNLELDRVIKSIKKEKAKLVLLQFPDGLKNIATEVSREIEHETGAKTMIWMGSCFGACDLPQPERMEKLGVDLIIQWGHTSWPFAKEGKKGIKILK